MSSTKNYLKKNEEKEKILDFLDKSEGSKSEQFFLEEKQKELKKLQDDLDKNLDTAEFLHKRWGYDRYIAEVGEAMIKSIDMGPEFKAVCVPTRKGEPIKVIDTSISANDTKDGILLVIKHHGKYYYKAFWLVRVAHIDIGALHEAVLELENTIDWLSGKLEGHKKDDLPVEASKQRARKSGIWVP